MPEFTQYDVTVAAQSYSQAASIVAGFAFMILVWLVESLHRRRDEGESVNGQTERALTFLAITFMANLMAALLWSVISGEAKAVASRPGILNFFVVLNFTLAAPLMFEALVFFLASAEVSQVIPLFRRVFFANVAIGLAFQWISTRGLLQALDRTREVVATNAMIFAVLLPLTVAIVLAGGIVSARPRHNRFGLNTSASFSGFSTAWLAAILVTSLAFGLVMAGGPDVGLAKWAVWACNLAWAGLMAWAMAFLPLRQPPPPEG